MRRANGKRLASAARCWTAYDCFQTLPNNSTTPDQSCSSLSDYFRSYDVTQDTEEDKDKEGLSSWGELILWVIVLVVILAVLIKCSCCITTRVMSREVQGEEVDEPSPTQTPSHGASFYVQNSKYVPEIRLYKVCSGEVKLWSLLHQMGTLMLDSKINIKETFLYTRFFLILKSYKS